MIKFFSKQMNKKGFTLIELIVVIAILAILALIAIPRIGKFRTNAAISTHNANVRTLESAASMCLAEKGLPTVDSVTWKGTEKPGDNEHLWENYIADWPDIPAGAKDQDLLVAVNDTTTVTGEKYEVTITKDGEVTVSPGLAKVATN